ncbi:uncharacterized protein LOC143836695 [Paroedura picta]|uniref:uncharacterized protein LOC143836695 n=1 Tax=Paroedura picta TaxID=143630 RepID=UPI004056B1ED
MTPEDPSPLRFRSRPRGCVRKRSRDEALGLPLAELAALAVRADQQSSAPQRQAGQAAPPLLSSLPARGTSSACAAAWRGSQGLPRRSSSSCPSPPWAPPPAGRMEDAPRLPRLWRHTGRGGHPQGDGGDRAQAGLELTAPSEKALRPRPPSAQARHRGWLTGRWAGACAARGAGRVLRLRAAGRASRWQDGGGGCQGEAVPGWRRGADRPPEPPGPGPALRRPSRPRSPPPPWSPPPPPPLAPPADRAGDPAARGCPSRPRVQKAPPAPEGICPPSPPLLSAQGWSQGAQQDPLETPQAPFAR